jgi:uncharacterized delta-60 repeat protein
VVSDLFGGTDDIAYAMSIQRDGKLIVAGHTGAYPNFRPGIVRYRTDGTFDPTFGNGGKVMSDFGGFSATLYGTAIQANGRIVVAGYASNSTTDFVVGRYLGLSNARLPRYGDIDP